MKICPITYEEFEDQGVYSKKGLKLLAPNLKELHDFEYTAEEQRELSLKLLERMSIQGFQPKLTAKLNIKDGKFSATDRGGTYILKPQTVEYRELPENEDLSMRLAKSFGIDIPLHGLIYSKDRSMTYFIKRFDRIGRGQKTYTEDFTQLAGLDREAKYEYSYEKCIAIIENFLTFPAIEKIKFFKMLLFSFVIGNDDLHLKNLSVIKRDDVYQLSPGYDFVNVHVAMGSKPRDELALTLKGKRKKLTYNDLIEYFAYERLELNEKTVQENLNLLSDNMHSWEVLIKRSFLSAGFKENYMKLVESRFKALGI